MVFQSPRFVVFAALICGASACSAQGLYVGGSVFVRKYDFSQAGTTPVGSTSGYGLSGKALVGYDFNDNWALEGAYVGFSKPSYRFTVAGADGQMQTSSHAWLAAVKASTALGNQWTLFGKLGLDHLAAQTRTSGSAQWPAQSHSVSALYLDAGLQYQVSKTLATTLELEHFGKLDVPGTSRNGFSAGLKYSF